MAQASKSKKKPTKKPATKKKTTSKKPELIARLGLFVRRLVWGVFFVSLGVVLTATLIYALISPPTTPYMFSESRRVGGVKYDWVSMEEIAPVMARSAVAAEDANFCLHWGLDVDAIRLAVDRGRGGASTISGVQAGARHYFGVDAADLSALQAARMAAILPSPKNRSASNPSQFTRDRTRQIIAGAQTIAADGRADCFER